MTPWLKPWWHAHLTGIAMAFIGIVVAFFIIIIWDRLERKRTQRLRQQHRGQRKTYIR